MNKTIAARNLKIIEVSTLPESQFRNRREAGCNEGTTLHLGKGTLTCHGKSAKGYVVRMGLSIIA